MTAQCTATAATPRFVRRTSLAPHEYRKNFHQIDREVIDAVTSPGADMITPLMSKVYLRLVSAPAEFWEGPGVLYFTAKTTEGGPIKSSKVLYEVLGVASATAHKALRWMHEQGIIGYSSGKNGVGIRIFLNRAAASIGVRENQPGKKILPFDRGSNGATRGSALEPAFKDSFAVKRDILDSGKNPRAPKNGADAESVVKNSPEPTTPGGPQSPTPNHTRGREVDTCERVQAAPTLDAIVERLKRELEPCLKSAAARSASQTAAAEMERTREWFETKALPKAVRVAQHETFALLRKHGIADERVRPARNHLEVGRAVSDSSASTAAHKLSAAEIRETAEICVALLETQGKSIELTLSEFSSEVGGWLTPEDAPRVREAARAIMLGGGKGEVKPG